MCVDVTDAKLVVFDFLKNAVCRIENAPGHEFVCYMSNCHKSLRKDPCICQLDPELAENARPELVIEEGRTEFYYAVSVTDYTFRPITDRGSKMDDTRELSRRTAMLATCAAAAIGLSPVASIAGDGQKPDGGDNQPKQWPLQLQIRLTDGQVVKLVAEELLIDFGSGGRLQLKADAFVPMSDGGSERGDEKVASPRR
jgi:hypothetical protein